MEGIRPIHTGSSGLVIAFDIGTTYSGISFAILERGQVPEIKPVTKFPGLAQEATHSKIPTIIYYDNAGKAVAFGAEATTDSIKDEACEKGWVLAEWFKMHMRPKNMRKDDSQHVPPLPPNKSVVELFADFLGYLRKCAKDCITNSERGREIWERQNHIQYVLTHPNGWEGAQQMQMRKAFYLAELVPDTEEGRSRIHFVTEGEASLHFCTEKGLMTQALSSGGVIIVDAGGGTIDVSSYALKPGTKSDFKEVARTQCHFQGSIFVTTRAENFLNDFLKDSRFLEYVGDMKEKFDQSTKLTFRDSGRPLVIKFGERKLSDPAFGIKNGQISIKGFEVAKFFEPSVSCIVTAVKSQRAEAHDTISSVFLVGGFAASDWLLERVKESLEGIGLKVFRPTGYTNKAVPDGAVSYYIDRTVSARISKFAYGVTCSRSYDESNTENRKRRDKAYWDIDGRQWLGGQFDVILHKNVQVTEQQEYRKDFYKTSQKRSRLAHLSSTIKYYCGASHYPIWVDQEPDMYAALCEVEADMPRLANSLQPLHNKDGSYYRIDYEVVFLFGLTELQAQICWKENGKEKRGPANIIY